MKEFNVRELRAGFGRRGRMGDFTVELETLLFAAFLEVSDRGWVRVYPFIDACFAEVSNLISRYSEHLWNTLVALGTQQAWVDDAHNQPSHSPPSIHRHI